MIEETGNKKHQFQALYDRYFEKVFKFTFRATKDIGEAEDLAQEVFLKMWQNRDSFASNIPHEVQLLTIARQLVINQYKRNIIRQKVYSSWYEEKQTFSSADNADQILLTSELSARYQQALAELPERRREIFEKSRIEGLSYDQIAEELQITRNTVETQISKALRSLREKLLLFFFLVLTQFF